MPDSNKFADPHQPLFPSSNDNTGTDSGPVGYPKIGSPVGYPQIGAVATRHAAGGDDGLPTANRQIPQTWIFAGAVVLVVAALIVGVLVFIGSSDSEEASSSRQIDSSEPSDTSDTSKGSDPPPSDSTGGTASNDLSFDRMRDFAYMHYADLPRNPSATWRRFDPELANKIGWQGYVDFWNTIASVTVMSVMPRNANSVVVRLKYVTRNGSTDTEDRSLRFVTSDGELRIFDSERIGSVG